MNALVVGGTSGLGECLAKRLMADGYDVWITGRTNRDLEGAHFIYADLNSACSASVWGVVDEAPALDLLVYAAGYYQEGKIDGLSDDALQEMVEIGLLAPALFVSNILQYQSDLPGFIAITSTSQWTPREQEPMYTAVKAGLGMLANSLSLDPAIHKTLVAGPGGMATRFWDRQGKNIEGYLDPEWVAEQILEQFAEKFTYRCIRIPREPRQVEVLESR